MNRNPMIKNHQDKKYWTGRKEELERELKKIDQEKQKTNHLLHLSQPHKQNFFQEMLNYNRTNLIKLQKHWGGEEAKIKKEMWKVNENIKNLDRKENTFRKIRISLGTVFLILSVFLLMTITIYYQIGPGGITSFMSWNNFSGESIENINDSAHYILNSSSLNSSSNSRPSCQSNQTGSTSSSLKPALVNRTLTEMVNGGSIKSAENNEMSFKADEWPKFKINLTKTEKNSLTSLVVGNVPSEEKATVILVNPAGEKKVLDQEVKWTEDGLDVILNKGRYIKAGLYQLYINISSSAEEKWIVQNFTWGVFAINTDKSIYLPGEKAFIGMAVLDDIGHTVCDADVTLEIIAPDLQRTVLSTEKGQIIISPECKIYGVTNLPDYYTTYSTSSAGIYEMVLTAITKNGVRTVQDNFSVQEKVDFDVSRKGPTRIFPAANYSMNFTFKANLPYMGLIVEKVPSTFDILAQEGQEVQEWGDEKIISWKVKLQPGEVHHLSYTFDPPHQSLELYSMGPLEIGQWKEARSWQMAADPGIIVAGNDTQDKKELLKISTQPAHDCSEFIPTQTGRYYCVDDDKFYKCKDFEYLADLPDGDLIRCLDAKKSLEKVSKADCPFNHPECNVTVDMEKGWGKVQVAEKKEYKLSTFHEHFHCFKGHCEVPFYFKSNISLEGNLTFDASAQLELRNISVEQVLPGGIKEKQGKKVSMQKDDSYYYLLIFDFTPEWTSETGIRYRKPLKFNVTAYLDGENILELDPIGYVDNPDNDVDTDCDAPSTVTLTNVDCDNSIGGVVIVGISIQDQGNVLSATYDGAAMTEISSIVGASGGVYSQMFYYQGANCDGSANNVAVSFTNGGNGDDCGVTALVYSGVNSVNTTAAKSNTTTNGLSVVGVSAGSSANWVVDTIAYDSTTGTISATGDNANTRVNYDDGNQKVGGSDDGGKGGTIQMKWTGSASVIWSTIAVPLVGSPDTNAPAVNNLVPAVNSIYNITNLIQIAANVTDNIAVRNVSANITYPNGTIYKLYLNNASTHNDKFNASFTIPELTGIYNVTYVANDSSSNINSTQTSNFTAEDTLNPSVTINFPTETTYDLAYVLPLMYNATLSEEGSVMYSLDDGLTNLSMDSTDNLNFSATDSNIAVGDYNFTVYANDTAGNLNHTESVNFSVVQESVILNGTITLANNTLLNTTIIIIGEEQSEEVYNDTGVRLEPIISLNYTYSIIITPLDIETIKRIEYRDVNLSEESSLVVELVDVDEADGVKNFSKVFTAIPRLKNYSHANLTFSAAFNSLYRCADWDYAGRSCRGNWSLFLSGLESGQNYTLDLEEGNVSYGMIEISRAVHLDANRTPISDIYDEVISLDGIWSETIPTEDYVQVTFAVPLTSANDITIYPRTVSGTPAIEIYESGGTEVIAEFTSLDDNQYNKVFLTGLSGSQDTFDLKIVGGEVEFDHIIDPTFYIRSDNDGATGATGTSSVTFTALSDTNYAALITAGTDDDTPFAREWSAKGASGFSIKIEDDAGGNEQVNTVYWVAIPYGEYNISAGVFIKCGTVTGSFSGGTITFDDAFSDASYAFICNPTTDDDSPVCLYDDTQKAAGSIVFKVEDDTDAAETVSAIDWCAFTSGEYTIDGIKFKAGVASISNFAGFTVSFGANFDDTSYVVMTTHGDSDTTDPAICEVSNFQVGSFDAVCEDDDGSAGGTGEYMDWFAVGEGDYDLSYGVSDTSPPAVTIVSPLAQVYATSTIVFNVSLNEAGGGCNVSIDNFVSNTTMTAENTTSYSFTNSSMSSGSYTASFGCADAAGNMNKTQSIGFTVDVTPPNVTTLIPAVNSIYNITNLIQIAANVTDNIAVRNVSANITYPNGTIYKLYLNNASTHNDKFNASFTISELTGVYNITFVANDSSSNINSTQTSNFTVNFGCGTITNSTTLTRNLSSSGTCFTIGASNVTLDCARYTITYGTSINGTGITSNGYSNLTIKNCNLIRGGTSTTFDSNGIYVANGNYSNITNNSIKNYGGTNSTGIFLVNSMGFVINDNTISTNGTSANNSGIYIFYNDPGEQGIFQGGNITNNCIYTNGTNYNSGIILTYIANSTIYNNTISTGETATGNNNYGISIDGNYNEINNNSITTSGTANNYGILLSTYSYENILLNNDLFTSPSLAIKDAEGYVNSLIYNNSFGEIRWTVNGSGNFSGNLTLNVSNTAGLGLGHNLFIANNTIAVNESAFNIGNINSSANLTLYGINYTLLSEIFVVANYSESSDKIIYTGTNCTPPRCFINGYSNVTGILLFNASSFSSFASNGSKPGEAYTAPTAPSPFTPANESHITNRTPTFGWNNSVSGETLTYNLRVDTEPDFSSPAMIENVTSIAAGGALNSSYDSTTELDVDTIYYWQVRANDSTSYGAWSPLMNFTVDSFLRVTLTTSTVAFAPMRPDQTNDTTDSSPLPFAGENSGNILANISVNATSYFTSVPAHSNYYWFKIRANEAGSFTVASSTTNWTSMNDSSRPNVWNLDWHVINNDFLADLNLTVPTNEPPGAKSSTITFTVSS